MLYTIHSRIARHLLATLFALMLSMATVAQTTAKHSCDLLLTPKVPKQKEYFPPHLFSDTMLEWYMRELSSMKEPSLNSTYCPAEIYRFLWLRSFHAPVAIRVWSYEGKHFLVAKMRHGRDRSRPGRFLTTRFKLLSETEWASFKGLLDQISFWEQPTDEPSVPNADGSFDLHLDGAQWLIEGLRVGDYHVTERWSPQGQYRETCLYLLRLTGLRVKSKEIY